ncbi:MAG: nucleotidyltransferase family protein [Lachnospiraceae bacterium]|nr:nucleotidyltransferase family protein [Lachnospiraceae bacterium]
MKITAVISEYNPLHNGHVHHFDKIRKETGADYLITVMSGDYVQRGAPAVIPKHERAKAALLSGADLVLELPLYYSTGSIEYFSRGAVSLIAKTGLCDCISFGSECGDINLLCDAAAMLNESENHDNNEILSALSSGQSYASVVNRIGLSGDNTSILLKEPNNLLAVYYIRAASHLGLDISFHTVKRSGAGYHDSSAGALSSTSIREELKAIYPSPGFNNDGQKTPDKLTRIKDRMPDSVYASLCEYLKSYPPMFEDDFSMLLYYKLHECFGTLNENLTKYLDVSDNIAGRIESTYRHANSFSGLINNIKSKDLAYTRISRALLHILLGITRDNMNEYIAGGYNYYLRILGFRKSASDLLHALKQSSSVPLITKCADHESILRDHYLSDNWDTYGHGLALRMFKEGINASELYNKAVCEKGRQPFISEYEHQVVII